MAKKIIKKVPVKIPPPIKEEAKELLEDLKTLPVEPEIITEVLETLPVIKEEFKEVIGVDLAEQLQKSGWQLIDCHQTPNGKLYKFKKGK